VIFNVMCSNLSHKVVGLSSLSNWPFFKCIAMVVHINILMHEDPFFSSFDLGIGYSIFG
jgi:hypothetical protein